MKYNTAWVRFVGVVQHLPVAPQSVDHGRKVRCVARCPRPTKWPFNRARRRFIPALRQKRCEQPVSRRIANPDILRRGGQVLDQTRRLAGSDPKGMDDLPARQAQQLCARHRRSEHAAGRRDVPSARIVAGRYAVADAASDLNPQNQSVENRSPRQSLGFGHRQHRGRHRRGGMNHRAQMGVVKVEEIGCGRVEETRAQNIQPLRAADYARLCSTGKRAHDIQCNRYRFAVC